MKEEEKNVMITITVGWFEWLSLDLIKREEFCSIYPK